MPSLYMRQPVSIHAPAGGATHALMPAHGSSKEFQSTHPRGVRHDGSTYDRQYALGFNPRTRGGCDYRFFRLQILDQFRFNPRTRGGCDIGTGISSGMPYGFNPRTRGGCDPTHSLLSGWYSRFQSTHPRGVRRFPSASQRRNTRVSIHAPAGGATVFFSMIDTSPPSFNPRTRGGCDMQGGK